jgi:hypothetical protein
MKSLITAVLGWYLFLKQDPKQAQRGLSQSTEVAILVAAAFAVATLIVLTIRTFVKSKLGEIG